MTWQTQAPVARARPRVVPYVALLAAGLCGLAAAAVGVAHQLLPRQFSPVQQHRITTWEWERRWRAVPAGKIFPATVSYMVSSQALGAAQGLRLHATRLGIGTATSCAAALPPTTAQVIGHYGCAAVMRATYVDASGSMVATIAVAVLPDTAKAKAAMSQLNANSHAVAALVRPLRVPGTEAAGFSTRQHQISHGSSVGPYLIITTVGFSDGRPRLGVSVDYYVDQEMSGLSAGLSHSAKSVLGAPPAKPTCPGAPGC